MSVFACSVCTSLLTACLTVAMHSSSVPLLAIHAAVMKLALLQSHIQYHVYAAPLPNSAAAAAAANNSVNCQAQGIKHPALWSVLQKQ